MLTWFLGAEGIWSNT